MVLFWGEDPFLLRLAALEELERRAVRATEVHGGDWRGGETADLATPSLFGEARGLLVTRCDALPAAGTAELLQYVAAPSPEAACVLTLVTSSRNPALARKVQAGGGAARQVAMKRQDLPRWVLHRAGVRGANLTPAAAAALVSTVGEDAGALDQAVEQLSTAFPGQPVGAEEVHRQFRGLGDQRVWDLLDQALAGRLPAALVALRSLLEARHDPLMILGGIAARVRDLLRIRELPERIPPAEAAKAAGLRFDWQVRRYRDQARRFSPEDLVALHARVVEADRALKGGMDHDVVLGSLVAVLAGASGADLHVPVRVSR